MGKRIVILLFLAVLLVFVYQAGFDSENPADINDVNDVSLEDPVDLNEAEVDFTYKNSKDG